MITMDGLRVALVGPLPPPMGGMATQTLQLADLLRAANADVEVVQSNAPYRPHWVGQVPMLRAVCRLLPYLEALWRAAGRAQLMHVMANSGWSWHLFAAPAIWIGWLRRVPVVVNYRGGEAERFLAGSARCVRWSMDRVARLIVPSGFLQGVFACHSMVAEVVPNIVDLERFRPQERDPSATPQVLVARNLEPIYDVATALRAFAIVGKRHPGARLIVAGTGPEAARLRALAQELHIGQAVVFVGRVERDAMASLLTQSAVALNPSRVDNMPNSVLEAMASGTPIVSTRVGGVPHVVEDGVTALLVPPGDPQAMADALIRLIEEPTLGRTLAAAALSEVRRYGWDRVAPVLADVYRSACTRAA